MDWFRPRPSSETPRSGVAVYPVGRTIQCRLLPRQDLSVTLKCKVDRSRAMGRHVRQVNSDNTLQDATRRHSPAISRHKRHHTYGCRYRMPQPHDLLQEEIGRAVSVHSAVPLWSSHGVSRPAEGATLSCSSPSHPAQDHTARGIPTSHHVGQNWIGLRASKYHATSQKAAVHTVVVGPSRILTGEAAPGRRTSSDFAVADGSAV